MKTHEVNGDKRLAGALALITRGSDHHPDVLVHVDEAREELSSMLSRQSWWSIQEDGSFGFPGGGRANNSHNLPETLFQNISRELAEELQLPRAVTLPRKKSYGVAQQLYPSVVAQLPRDLDEPHLNQIAVTSVTLPYDQFSSGAKSNIDALTADERAMWISIEDLHRISLLKDAQTNADYGYVFRPQVLTAARIWYLTRFCGLNTPQVRDKIIAGNRRTIAFISSEAARMNRTIVNGTFQKDGTVDTTVVNRDRHFLFGVPRRK